MGIWYCSREDVQRALDFKTTARDNAQIDRAIEAVSRGIEGPGLLNRGFYPLTATRTFDWPARPFECVWRIWLGESELISATSVTVNGVILDPSKYTLEPGNDGPPFYRIDIPTSAGVDHGSTRKNAVSVAGLFGHSNAERQIGALSSSLAASPTATAQAVWTTAACGVGDLLRIDTERMVVTAKTLVTSNQTLQTPVGASNAETIIAVSNGAAFAVDTLLLLDAERMLVVDIAGNNLIVKRAWDGTVLAAHTGSTVYTLSGVELDRAQLGTALALHNSAAAVYQWQVPGPVKDLAVAEVLNRFEQERSAYARTVGAGESLRNASGAGIADIRAQAYASHGRKLLTMVT